MKIVNGVLARAISVVIGALWALGTALPARAALAWDSNTASTRHISWDGHSTSSRIDPCAAGDLNGDGIVDIAMSAQFGDTQGLTDNGSVFVVYGPFPKEAVPRWLFQSHNFNVRVDGPSASSQLDWCQIMDFNLDGREDLVVYRANMAAAWVLYGPLPAGTGNVRNLSDTLHYSVKVTYNDAEEVHFGFHDLNSDAVPDLISEVPGADVNGVDAGAVYVTYGNSGIIPASGTGGLLDLQSASKYNLRFIGNSASDWLGVEPSISGRKWFGQPQGLRTAIGDLNGDGTKDWAIPASHEDTWSRTDNGSIYVATGPWPSVGSTGNSRTLTAGNGNYMLRLDGHDASSFPGHALIADLTGDGANDLCATFGHGDRNGTDSGSVYCWQGPVSFSTHSVLRDLVNAPNYSARFDGRAASDHLSWNTLEAVDLNADGFLDLYISDAHDDQATLQEGSAYVVYGGSAFPVGPGSNRPFSVTSNYNIRIREASGNDHMLAWDQLFKDLDGDGVLDILLHGIQEEDTANCGTTNRSNTYAFFGPLPPGLGVEIDADNDYDLWLTYADCGRSTDRGLIVEDFDRGGYPELLVSRHYNESNGLADNGRVVLSPWEPFTPYLTAPGRFINSTAPVLTWNAVTSATSYRVMADEDPLFLTPVFDSIVSATTANLSGLSNGETYYVRVQAQNGAFRRWGPIHNFTVDTTAPSIPVLAGPGDDTGAHPAVNTQTPTFDWSDVSSE